MVQSTYACTQSQVHVLASMHTQFLVSLLVHAFDWVPWHLVTWSWIRPDRGRPSELGTVSNFFCPHEKCCKTPLLHSNAARILQYSTVTPLLLIATMDDSNLLSSTISYSFHVLLVAVLSIYAQVPSNLSLSSGGHGRHPVRPESSLTPFHVPVSCAYSLSCACRGAMSLCRFVALCQHANMSTCEHVENTL